MSSELRQRAGDTNKTSKSVPATKAVPQPSGGIGLLDIGRTIVFLFLASGLLSWFITGKDFFWGHRWQPTTLTYWQTLLKGEPTFTDAQLKAHDGSNPGLPIYVALNGSVYDVTSGRRFYGPDGSYSFFSGPDNTRAFVTTCFDSPPSHDLRGVEEMHLPITTPEIDALYTSGQLKAKKEQEMRIAKKKIEESLSHWVGFFATSGKYPYVGKVKRSPVDASIPPPPLCQKALDGRQMREVPPGKSL